MKKIITAINNPNLNEELKKEKNMNIVCKDIQYKEAILELLEKNIEVDIIIIYENLPGEISLIETIEKIREKNKKIKIIIILEKVSKEKEEKLKHLNIFDIYYNNEINIYKLIEIIKNLNTEEEMKKEIEKLKKIIIENKLEKKINNYNKIINKENNKNKKTNKKIKKKLKIKDNLINKKEQIKNYNLTKKIKNIKIIKIKNCIIKNIKKLKEKYLNYKKSFFYNCSLKRKYQNEIYKIIKETTEKSKHNKNKSNKIIIFFGTKGSGKSLISVIFSYYLKSKRYKVALVDLDINNQNLNKFLFIQNKCVIKLNGNKKIKKIEKNKKESNIKLIKKKYIKNKKLNKEINYKELLKKLNYKNKKIIKLKKIKNKEKNNFNVWNQIKENKNNKINNLRKIKKYKINKKIKYNNNIIKIIKIIKEIKLNNFNKLISLSEIKINDQIFLYNNFKDIIKNFIFNKKSIEYFFKSLLDYLNLNFDFIVIDLGIENCWNLNTKILDKSNKNLIILEPNILGIEETQKLLDNIINKWKIDKNSLHIMVNKYNKYSINKKVLLKIFKNINFISNINMDKYFTFLINTKFKFLNLRKLKKYFENIINN